MKAGRVVAVWEEEEEEEEESDDIYSGCQGDRG